MRTKTNSRGLSRVTKSLLLASTLAVPLAVALAPTPALACACGCGIFDVGADTLPSEDNFLVWFRYSYMDQNQNWEGDHKAPASDNQDKNITTNFFTAGGEYMIDDDWTVMGELPVFNRSLTTTDDGTVFGAPGSIYTGRLTSLGDAQLSAMYTGFAADLSTGLSLGIKLPTGDYKGPSGPLGGLEFDRDSLPGTGSTDLMIGGYHTGALLNDQSLTYFVQARYTYAFLERDSYRPGNEFDGAAGLTYDLGEHGPLDKLAGVLQLVASSREKDGGLNADLLNSGYSRLLVGPGIDLQIQKFRIFADVELPIYQHTNAATSLAIEGTSGQLVAGALYKLQLAYAL